FILYMSLLHLYVKQTTQFHTLSLHDALPISTIRRPLPTGRVVHASLRGHEAQKSTGVTEKCAPCIGRGVPCKSELQEQRCLTPVVWPGSGWAVRPSPRCRPCKTRRRQPLHARAPSISTRWWSPVTARACSTRPRPSAKPPASPTASFPRTSASSRTPTSPSPWPASPASRSTATSTAKA